MQTNTRNTYYYYLLLLYYHSQSRPMGIHMGEWEVSEWSLTSHPTQYRSFQRRPSRLLHIHIIMEQKKHKTEKRPKPKIWRTFHYKSAWVTIMAVLIIFPLILQSLISKCCPLADRGSENETPWFRQDYPLHRLWQPSTRADPNCLAVRLHKFRSPTAISCVD